MKILSAEQIKACDQYTIENEPVSSIDLMERAALACFKRIVKLAGIKQKVIVFCGQGNNGGDGLAIARMLNKNTYNAKVVIIHHKGSFSADALTNYKLLKVSYPAQVTEIHNTKELGLLNEQADVAIDALLGTGINSPVQGLLAETIDHINKNYNRIISIDVPSGLFVDERTTPKAVRSTLTLSFQLPKLSFLLPGNRDYVPDFEILDIGLMQESIGLQQTNNFYVTAHDICGLLKERSRFSHKGTFGHGLLMAGSRGKSGAAILAARACLRSGAGLLTVHSGTDTLAALLHALPEAMGIAGTDAAHISELEQAEKYDAIGFGPGAGMHAETQQVLKKLLQYYSGRLVIDADGLNILSENKTWLEFLPAGTILTPHPKEFERLTQKHNDDEDRLKALKYFSLRYNCIVVLKGAFTAIAMPDGNVFFNSSGNPGLAKGGSGDALTGIILGLMTRGYSPPQAALIGVFVHGYAADLLLEKRSMESMLVTDVIEQLPKAFRKLEEMKRER